MNAEELAGLAELLMDLVRVVERLDGLGFHYAAMVVENAHHQLAEVYRKESKP